MTDQTWCIAGGEDGAGRQLADALLRGGNTVAVVGRNVAPFALLVDDYADAVMPVELTATTSEALAEVRTSIELNLGEVSHFAVLLGELGEGTPEQVADRLLAKLSSAGQRRGLEGAGDLPEDRWPADAQLVLVRGAATAEGNAGQSPSTDNAGSGSLENRTAQNADIEARIRLATAQSEPPVPPVRVRELAEMLRSAPIATHV